MGLFACFGKRTSPSSSSSSKTAQSPPEADDQAKGGGGGGPGVAVMVELFSSQGCAASPAAELVASRLGRGDFELDAPVVVLAYHVDYWDYMGWKDPFGSSQWTVRQKAYVESLGLDAIFTPQIVVQGRSQCMGNDEDALLSAISSAPRFPSPAFQVRGLPNPDYNTCVRIL